MLALDLPPDRRTPQQLRGDDANRFALAALNRMNDDLAALIDRTYANWGDCCALTAAEDGIASSIAALQGALDE